MLSEKQVATRLKAVTRSRDKMRENLHELAVSIIGHVHAHGDVTLGDRLLTAMGRGMDRQAMIYFLEANGPFRFEAKKGEFAFSRRKADEMEFDEEFLMSGEKWYEYGKATKNLASAFDIEKRAAGLLASLKKAADEGKEVKNAEFATYLRTALIKYHEDQEAA